MTNVSYQVRHVAEVGWSASTTTWAQPGCCSATISSYDVMGRVITEWQWTPLWCGSSAFLMTYNYNLLTTTNYYHGDHLGSSRVMTEFIGYPTWSATYLRGVYPERSRRGQELVVSGAEPWNPHPEASGTVNHYKFTHSTHSVRSGQAGLERDAESGLDHTWFSGFGSPVDSTGVLTPDRQYSSGYGRYMRDGPRTRQTPLALLPPDRP